MGGMIKATPPIRCSWREAPAGQVISHVRLAAERTVQPTNVSGVTIAALQIYIRGNPCRQYPRSKYQGLKVRGLL